jgi:hypothetical protein
MKRGYKRLSLAGPHLGDFAWCRTIPPISCTSNGAVLKCVLPPRAQRQSFWKQVIQRLIFSLFEVALFLVTFRRSAQVSVKIDDQST